MRSEASQDAIDIYDMFLTMVEDMKQKTRDGTADESDWENVISLEKGVKSSILILEENIIMLEQLAEKDVEYNEYIGYIGYRGYYC